MGEVAPWTDEQARAEVGRVEELLGRLESLPPRPGRDTGEAAVEALVDLYGAALTRVVAHIRNHTEVDSPVLAALRDDELVSQVLVAHGLLPDPETETPVELLSRRA